MNKITQQYMNLSSGKLIQYKILIRLYNFYSSIKLALGFRTFK